MKDLFNLNKKYDLIRLGRDNDGGYLVEKKSMLNARFLVGMGLNDDWSFEKDFNSLNSVKIHVYDHTVNRQFWISYYQRLGREILFKGHWRKLKQAFTYYRYLLFFRNNIHFKECVGRDIFIKELFSRIDSFPIFLKIDIEGSEYKILDDLILHSKYISGLVIEFHFMEVYLKKICSFVENFELQLVHIHGNNFGGQTLSGYPKVVEFTFSKNPIPISEKSPNFPHPLDMPNDKNSQDLNINFLDF